MRIVVAVAVAAGLSAAGTGAQKTAKTDVLDVHHLPLGDGRVSTNPSRGSVMACNMAFRQGGAQHAGPWIHDDTWDLTEKIAVQGRVTWPDAQFAITTSDTDRVVTRILRGNGLPVDTPTGQFPVARTDPAFLRSRICAVAILRCGASITTTGRVRVCRTRPRTSD